MHLTFYSSKLRLSLDNHINKRFSNAILTFVLLILNSALSFGQFDLALRKEVITALPSYGYGQNVMYKITIFNQGTIPASNIIITDYLPCGFSFDPSLPTNAGWSLSGNNIVRTYTGTISPAKDVELYVEIKVIPCYNDPSNAWTNYAEISSAINANTGAIAVDIDSNADNNKNNDLGGVPNFETFISGTDNTIFNENGDEDDHDSHKIQVFDLALRKTVDSRGPFSAGQSVTFRIRVFNQGNVTARNIVINDYMRNGFSINLSNNPGWSIVTLPTNSSIGKLQYTLPSNLIPNAYIEIPLVLDTRIDTDPAPTDWYNYAEIGSAMDTVGFNRNDDADSAPSSNTIRENSVLPDSLWDNLITGNGPNFNQDEDDHDVEMITMRIDNGEIGDRVWHDINGDGIQNSGEPGIPGVQVDLYRGNILVGTKFTDGSGKYLFNNLRFGNYYLEFKTPLNYFPTFANQGVNDAFDSDIYNSNGIMTTQNFDLSSGQQNLNWDAGYYQCVGIGDLIWYDYNKNNVADANENGINGLRINLWRQHMGSWNIIDHTFSGAKPGSPSDDGYFKFCAPPGTYYIQVMMPPIGLVRVIPNVGTNEEIDSDITNRLGVGTTDLFTLNSGQQKTDLGAGFYPSAAAGNLVWRDDNVNGVQDANETNLKDVMVEAIESSTGNVAATTFTDQDGIYNLDYLEQDEYYMRFTPPAGYTATVSKRSTDDMDSDVDHSNGLNTTRKFQFASGQHNENIDMGVAYGVLPVDWLDVNVREIDNTHMITWSTAREINTSHYELERKLEKENDFYLLPGKVVARGNTVDISQYSMTDESVDKPGLYIYRVKQTDFDGHSTYSNLVSINHNSTASISIYPNPAKNETTLYVSVLQDSNVEIEVYDNTNKLYSLKKSQGAQKIGESAYNLDLDGLLPGLYNVVITVNGKAIQKKLVKIE